MLSLSTSTRRAAAAAALLVAATACAAPLQAQEGGLRVGAGRLHPSIEGEGRYDSFAMRTPDGVVRGDMVLHLRPGLKLEVPSDAMSVDLSAFGDLNYYVGLEGPSSNELSYFGGDGSLKLGINPKGFLGVDVFDTFTFSDRTSVLGLGAGIRSIFNEAGVSVPVRPGGGALVFAPGYAFALERFVNLLSLPPGVASPGDLNYISHRPSFRARWAFFPRTALVLEARGDLRQYASGANPAASALYVQGGLSGLVTSKLSLQLRAGYGNAFLDPASGLANFESAIGQAELTFHVTETIKLRGGYVRTFQPVPQLGYYVDDRGSAAFEAMLGGRLQLKAEGAFDVVTYASGRTDFVSSFKGAADLRVTRWLFLGAGYAYSLRDAGAAGGPASIFDYDRHEAWGKLTLSY